MSLADVIAIDPEAGYYAASRGELSAHVWRSEQHTSRSGRLMDIIAKFSLPGVVLEEDDHGLSPEFARGIGVYYAGILSVEEAARNYRMIQESTLGGARVL